MQQTSVSLQSSLPKSISFGSQEVTPGVVDFVLHLPFLDVHDIIPEALLADCVDCVQKIYATIASTIIAKTIEIKTQFTSAFFFILLSRSKDLFPCLLNRLHRLACILWSRFDNNLLGMLYLERCMFLVLLAHCKAAPAKSCRICSTFA